MTPSPSLHGVAITSLWVAAVRAMETERNDSLFRDPFARRLAGEEGFRVLRQIDAIQSVRPPTIEVRTRFFDDATMSAAALGIRQVVILAAGMDARAYRLDWPEATRVFEVDQPEVLEYKARILEGASPHCDRRAVSLDLRDDWPAALRQAGFAADVPALWLVEGLLPYLRESDVIELLSRISRLSTAKSVLVFDCVGRSVLESPWMKYLRDFVAKLGAPWNFGTDEPEALLAPREWQARATDFAEMGHKLGRWPFPVAPRGTPGVPYSFLLEAVRIA